MSSRAYGLLQAMRREWEEEQEEQGQCRSVFPNTPDFSRRHIRHSVVEHNS